MIHVDKTKVEIPEVLSRDEGSPWMRELWRAQKFYEDPANEERRFPFKIYRHRAVRDVLMELFHSKCAYCERRFGGKLEVDVEHYRPKGSVLEEDGARLWRHYYWLAGDWDNLLVACASCNRQHSMGGKGNRFPINGRRAGVQAGPKELASEQPLLLNPCVDQPDEHLIFESDGMVFSETERGQVTIDVLALNRAHLVASRRQAILISLALLERLRMLGDLASNESDQEMAARMDSQLASLANEIKRSMDDDQEFAAARRHALRPHLDELRQLTTGVLVPKSAETDSEPDDVVTTRGGYAIDEGELDSPDDDLALELDDHTRWQSQSAAPWQQLEQTPDISQVVKTRAKRSYDDFVQAQASFSIEQAIAEESKPESEAPAEHKAKYFGRRRLIESIRIKNVKGIHDLELDFTASESSTAPWTMLLGENATGKSTILRGVALALVGKTYIDKLRKNRGFDPADYVRWPRCKKGWVEVRLGSIRRRVTFHSDSRITYDGASDPQNFVFAFGATRLLSAEKTIDYGEEWARVDNLFDPFQPLVPADVWLRQLANDNPDHFQRTCDLWQEVLAPEGATQLEVDRRSGEIHVTLFDTKVPLRHLSDGYQSVLALTSDVLQKVFALWGDPEEAEGLILLDEVGSHLHPTWKMNIVGQLRRLLPNMQFIASSHEPLCLRGIYDGETILMQRDENKKIQAVADLPSPRHLRVDQLLTSRWFGLNTTLDPDLDRLFDEYYQLLGLSAEDLEKAGKVDRLDFLRDRLSGEGILGYTRRDQLIYEAIDDFLAEERKLQSQSVERDQLDEKRRAVKKDIAKLWSYAQLTEGLRDRSDSR